MAEIGLITAERPTRVTWSDRGKWLGRQLVILLIVLGPVLAILTAFALTDENRALGAVMPISALILVDLCYVLALGALIAWRIGALLIARRKRSIGTRLHLRLAGVFAVVALVPTIIVAVFATLTVNFGIEGWFSDRIGSVVRNSLDTAEAYQREHRSNIRGDVLAMARDINRAASRGMTQAQLNELVVKQALLRELPEAYVFNLDKEIVARGEYSYLFNFEPPTDAQLESARQGEIIVIEDDGGNEIRALIYLTNLFDSYLYVSRTVRGDVLRLLDETRATVRLYEQLENDRGRLLFDYALIYIGFALLIIMAAILLGLWFAERLAKPVGRLAGAAEMVGAGDLDVRVKEERGNDEIALLSTMFNRMTGQLKSQRDALISARDETESRRMLLEAVLSGVTAGVIGIDVRGRVDLINDAATEMLGAGNESLIGKPLAAVVPGFEPMLEQARIGAGAVARCEARHIVHGEHREFVARMAPRSPETLEDGFVLTFDDMTALGSAQRMAAWGDVARRIAHEIKNPLTPIQLSADRIRRKFAKRLGDDGDAFEQYLDVITRQAGDIRRMVDEFSKFARMPEPNLSEHDLCALIREAVILQREANGGIEYWLDIPESPVSVICDRGLISQCLTNLLKNAGEAIEGRRERDGETVPHPCVRITMDLGHRFIRVGVEDNGIGLPEDDRDRLTDPYVTTRSKGTGLGLAIVKKIAEQHGGEVALGDAGGDGPDGCTLDGARVVLKLPRPVGRKLEPAETVTADGERV